MLALSIASVRANFHVLFQQNSITNEQGGGDVETNFLIGCASENLNCNCYKGSGMVTTPGVVDGTAESPLAGLNFFSLANNAGTGLCDSGPLDFYLRPGSDHWDVYRNGGDGTVLADCFPNPGVVDFCDTGFTGVAFGQTLSVIDTLVCFSSSICPQAG